MAAYVAVILPVIASISINFSRGKTFFEKKLSSLKNLNVFYLVSSIIIFALFYISLLYTQARSAILAFWLVLPLLVLFYFWFYLKPALSAKKFNDAAKNDPSITILFVSADLPFAQKRMCQADSLENIQTLSMMRSKDFAIKYGVLLTDGPLAGLTARAVVVLDENDNVLS